MAQPPFDFHQVKTRSQPIRRRGFAETVKVVLLANRPLLACDFGCVPVVVTTFSNRRLAVPAVEPRSFRDRFELSQKVALGLAISVREDPSF